MLHLKFPQLNSCHTTEDSRQSGASYVWHDRWLTEQQCQRGAPNEQCRIALSRASSLQSLVEDSSSDSPVSTDRQTATTCICQCLLFSGALILLLSDRFTSLHAVQLPCYMWLQGLLVPTLHSLHQSAGRGEGRRRQKERGNRLEHFSGVPSFIIWSARSCWTTNQKCAKEKERENNKTQTRAVHSSLHQEKSHPRAKPATFLGPVILFSVFISVVGFLTWLFNARLWRLTSGLI